MHGADEPAPLLTALESCAILSATIAAHPMPLPKTISIAFEVVGEGSFLLDTRMQAPLVSGWSEVADACVVLNRRTWSDLAQGLFDPARPTADHFFLWGGDESVWSSLSEALTGAKSMLAARREQKELAKCRK